MYRTKQSSLGWGLFLVVSISGCASGPTYVPPASQDTATVRFTTPDGTINNPVAMHTDRCSFDDAKLIGRLRSKTIGDKYTETIETQFEANKKLSVSMVAAAPIAISLTTITTRSCWRIVDFYPKSGGLYEVSFVYVDGRCYYNVDRIEKDLNGNEIKHPDDTASVRPDCILGK